MLEIYCFDIGALAVLVTMLVTIFFRKMTKGRLNNIFIQLVSVTLAAGSFDIVSNMVNGSMAIPEVAKYAITGCYYVCRAIGFFLYARYIIELSDVRHVFNKKWYRHFARPPVMLAFALTIVTYFNHMCYFYSSKGYYIRGRWNIIFYLICGGYAIFAVYGIVRNMNYFGFARSLSLISVAGFSMITAYVQYLYPYVVVDVLGFTMSLLFIMLFINNPEEKADSVSGVKNYRAYLNDLRRVYEIKKPVIVVFANIINFPALENMISFENFFTLAHRVAARMESINDEYKTHGELYYLRNGRFRIIILENELSGQKFNELYERLLNELTHDIQIGSSSVYIESNICVSRALEDFNSVDELINFGGLLDKEEKHDYVMYASKLLETTEYDIATKLDEIMERGILNNTFEIYYQPIYSVKEKRFTHAEALLRLFDYEFGLIDPENIISAAEQNGNINKIGKIVIEDVCKFISSEEYKKLGLTAVALNISLIQLMQKDFADEFISIMQSYGVRSDQIILEITESEAAEIQKTVVDNIEIIAKNGTKFSLNNYGTGYSNITTTSILPLASSKLDRTLINSEKNEKLEVIIENSIKLLKTLGRTVVVVGVETEDTLKKYEELDVDYIQGYYFSRPLDESHFVYFIEHSQK